MKYNNRGQNTMGNFYPFSDLGRNSINNLTSEQLMLKIQTVNQKLMSSLGNRAANHDIKIQYQHLLDLYQDQYNQALQREMKKEEMEYNKGQSPNKEEKGTFNNIKSRGSIYESDPSLDGVDPVERAKEEAWLVKNQLENIMSQKESAPPSQENLETPSEQTENDTPKWML